MSHPMKAAVDQAMRVRVINVCTNNSVMSVVPWLSNSFQCFCKHHFVAVYCVIIVYSICNLFAVAVFIAVY